MSYTDLFPSNEARGEAGRALGKILLGPVDEETDGIWLHEHLSERASGAESILAADKSDGASELPYRDLPGALVDMFGNEIFGDRDGAVLRDRILDKLFERNDYQRILRIFLATVRKEDSSVHWRTKFGQDPVGTARCMVKRLQEHRRYHWRPGKSYARTFVREMGLDYAFAGIRSEPMPERFEEAVARAIVPGLTGFQRNMKAQILQMLESGSNRAIVTLPTGAGKTRIVAEAVVDFLNERGTNRNILWIAQNQEVCEQAVLCFKQMWEHKGRGKALKIFRAWGDNDIPGPDERGVIVGGVDKLYACMNEMGNISENGILSAVFVDEAHHSVAKSYKSVLEGLGMSPFPDGTRTNDAIPLIGLTATPERRKDHETAQLARMYGGRRIFPHPNFEPATDSNMPFDENWQDLDFMRDRLTKLEYLAEVDLHPIDPGSSEVRLTEEETADLERGKDKWLTKIATEAERNRNIKSEILKWAEKRKKILYFGTNVSQSNAMAQILNQAGIRSACITGETRYATRRMLVDAFNTDNEIQVLCNYNVLSTGFDSPQIDTVIIARPTTSAVSYRQMVGRGLRGAKFGGGDKNRCDIVTVKDNIVKFNNEQVNLAYREFEQYAAKLRSGQK